jgi:peptidoglycan hydrolase-like protein with peptidoglycan-binding domain
MSDDPETTAAPDRSWWADVYKLGITADLDGQPRTPPAGLMDDQKNVWLAGYDR